MSGITLDLDDTIAALASPPGGAVRGLIRITGSQAQSLVAECLDLDDPKNWQAARLPAQHTACWSFSPDSASLSVGVHLWPTQRSYTGQPMVELHTVGSPPILEAILKSLFAAGIRPARRGEFTLRAFLCGRLDLVKAEAVLGVIDAHDHVELELALKQLAGGISSELSTVRGDLMNLLADVEAGLDFVEEDIEFIEKRTLIGQLARAEKLLTVLYDQAEARTVSQTRLRVVLAGLPNAGKSTLFNCLTGDDRALVSEQQGTTRDYLAANVTWKNLPLELVDTAGWETPLDELNAQAQQQRQTQLDQADLILWCMATDLNREQLDNNQQRFTILRTKTQTPLLLVRTKSDLESSPDSLTTSPENFSRSVSATTGDGLVELREEIWQQLQVSSQGERQLLGSTAARCQESLSSSIRALQEAQSTAASGMGDEIIALEIREVLEHLGRILGTVYTDDILDRIFSRFCIGK